MDFSAAGAAKIMTQPAPRSIMRKAARRVGTDDGDSPINALGDFMV
jgi:hypothetical protein